MPRFARILALLVLALAPAGCEWCRAPDSWQVVGTGLVRDSAGAVIGEARVTLAGIGEVRTSRSGWLTVEMTGPAALAGTPAGFPAGGPLQGWVNTIRLERASGVELFRARPRRGAERAVFERVGAQVGVKGDTERFLALRRDLLDGRLQLEVDVLPDSLAPRLGRVRGTLTRVDTSQQEGGCT